jgi:hypothetical protein
MDRHALAEERSLAMHRAVPEKLRADPALVERARLRVAGWREDGSVHEAYIAAWEAALGLPLDQLCAQLVDEGEPARALRQVSPFAGVLDPRERWRVCASLLAAR